MAEDYRTCGCVALVILLNISVGGWSVDYLLKFFLDKNIPFIGDALIGLFIAEFSVPIAIVVALLRYFGVL